MLILPLHKPLVRATFPFVTVLLVAINVMVFVLGQSGDPARLAQLQSWYVDSGLAQQDWPRYLAYLEQQGDVEALADARASPEDMRGVHLFHARLMDARLDAALRANGGADGSTEAESAESEPAARLQREYDTRADQITTYRYLLRYSEVDPVRLVTHAFLHSGVMHLIGNMLFLVALGLLVEGPLGEWRFALLYLVGILGSGLFSLAWHWGEGGGGLGASGAIAALMGAFCVIWGRRPVRFFWWFFVAFGYVRKPAIWLLPAWIGWEALNLTFNADAGIGYDAHLGGLLTGALAGWALVRSGQLREDFFAERAADGDLALELDEARAALGRMELARAEEHLSALLDEHPASLDVMLLRHRAAVLANRSTEARQRALAALALPARHAQDVARQFALLEESLPVTDHVPPGPWRSLLHRRWLTLGQYESVEKLLERWLADEAGAAQWFELALARRDAGNHARLQQILVRIVEHFPDAPEARKARFLLEQDG